MITPRKTKLLHLLDEYCNEYDCKDCYFSKYDDCPLSKTANRLQDEIFAETYNEDVKDEDIIAFYDGLRT